MEAWRVRAASSPVRVPEWAALVQEVAGRVDGCRWELGWEALVLALASWVDGCRWELGWAALALVSARLVGDRCSAPETVRVRAKVAPERAGPDPVVAGIGSHWPELGQRQDDCMYLAVQRMRLPTSSAKAALPPRL